MKKDIYLHIGWPKTATSTIQNGIIENIEVLSRKDYLYPNTGLRPVAHHNIVEQLKQNEMYNPKLGGIEELKKEITNSKKSNVIISSEGFASLNESQISSLHNSISRLGNIHIIAYLRRQDQWIVSMWSQMVRTGLTIDDFNTYLQKSLNFRTYFSKLKDWDKFFGKINLTVRVFEKSQLNGHIFIDFLKACNVQDVNDISIPVSYSVSPSLKELEITRQVFINLYETLGNGLQEFERVIIFNAIHNFGKRYAWDAGGRPSLINKALFEAIRERYHKSNCMIASTYLNQNRLFLEPFHEKPITKFDLSDVSSNELLELMAYLIKQCLSKYDQNKDVSNPEIREIIKLNNENEKLRSQLQSMRSSRGWKILERFQRIRNMFLDRL